jgi:hypothetical protein
MKIWESIGTPTPKVGAHLGAWGFVPSHLPTLLGAWNVTLGLHSHPARLQALALVANPRLRSWHWNNQWYRFYSYLWCWNCCLFQCIKKWRIFSSSPSKFINATISTSACGLEISCSLKKCNHLSTWFLVHVVVYNVLSILLLGS